MHLDRRAGQLEADALAAEVAAMGRVAVFHNVNAADDAQRAAVIASSGSASRRAG